MGREGQGRTVLGWSQPRVTLLLRRRRRLRRAVVVAGQVPDLVLRSTLYANALQAIEDVDLFANFDMNFTMTEAAVREEMCDAPAGRPALLLGQRWQVTSHRPLPTPPIPGSPRCWMRPTSWTAS